MCGIAGFLDGGSTEALLDRLNRMIATLRHRGPEQQGSRVLSAGSVRVGLGHARLKIIDLSDAASQPMANDDGSVWVAFNGEIYNYHELRSSLQQRGVRFRTASDTEVILRWYEAEGASCVQRFDGMFAFAVWDGRHRRLLLARDRVGKKPLFYASSGARFAFASEIKALLQDPRLAPEVNGDALAPFFLYGYVPNPQTLYRGIRAVPPGHLLHVTEEGERRLEMYWDVPLPHAASDGAPSGAQAATTVRQLLAESVRRRLVADVPLGAFLSGGLDSSIVVGLMSQLQAEPVKTFSIGFANQPYFDETPYARLASQRFGTRHTECFVEPASVDLVEQLVWHHDGPFADSSAIPTYLLSRLARQHVTVALNGDGGDELFAGYLRFGAALLADGLPEWARGPFHAVGTRLPLWGGMRGPVRRLQKFAGGVRLPFTERLFRWTAVFYDDLSELLTEARSDGRSPAPLHLLDPYLARAQHASPLTRLLYLNLKTYLPDDLLVKTDRCSMAHALEVRSPFLDRALIEYVFSLPDAMKLRWGRTKPLLRSAFAPLVPPEILRRGKMGFGVPLEAWFASDLRAYIGDLLLSPGAQLRRYVNQTYVRHLYEAHMLRRADYSDQLWTLLTFEVWLKGLSAPEASPVPALAVR
ncbi:MAG: asparagine synthase (glutamine-hydrolyzing) [Candidatus Omnitrophica bacterium]|nr:asparagine synthase (glutamine-hydrolyzing) [Candidatus Omnitrophota bacterium]